VVGSTVVRVRCSVVVPAHNEELLLPRALASIRSAASRADAEVEIVVVANRCTDDTVLLARGAGATVVASEARNIAAVRNDGVARSAGEVVVTMDADAVMAECALVEVDRRLTSGRYVGGGTKVRLDRTSAGIRTTLALVEITTFVLRLGGGMFWCARRDFDAIGGFDESLLLAEDLAFARRLRDHGRRTDRRFTVLRDAPLVVSARKFDRYGDWHMLRMVWQLPEIRASLRGRDTAFVDRYFFDFNG